MQRTGLIIWIAVGAVILGYATLVVLDAVRVIWLPVAVAAGMVFLLEPAVSSFARMRVPRPFAAILVFVAATALLVAATALIFPTLRDQASQLGENLPSLYDEFLRWLRETGDRFGVNVDEILTEDFISEWLNDPANQETITGLLLGFGSGAGQLISGFAETIAVIALAPFLALYILIDLDRFRQNAFELTPRKYREEATFLSTQVIRALGSFVRGQLLVAFIVGVASTIGMWAIDLPFWLLIGIIAGVFNMIPFVGPFVAGALAAVVALLDGNVTQAIVAVVIMIAIQQVDNHVITPLVQRTQVNLSPLVIVLALVIGGSLAGLLGVLIAVPTTAAITIIVGHFWRTRMLGQSWREASDHMIGRTEPPERIAGIRVRNPTQTRLFDTQEISALQDPPDSGDGEKS